MPDLVVVPNERTAISLVRFHISERRTQGLAYIGSEILSQYTPQRIEESAMRYYEYVSGGFHPQGLGGPNFDAARYGFYCNSQIFKFEPLWIDLASPQNECVIVTAPTNVLRGVLPNIFPWVRWHCELNRRSYNESLLSEAFLDMVQFIDEHIPPTRGIND